MAEPEAMLIRSRTMAIEEAWIDYNGHLNMAYYNVLFDRAVDDVLIELGLGPAYAEERKASYFTVETHLCYVGELSLSDQAVVESRLIDADDKRLHVYQELYHAGEGWLSATSEQMHLHVDMEARRAAPWPDDIRARIDAMLARHQTLTPPDRVGRRIGIPRKLV